MELKRRFSFRKIITILYIVAFLAYLIVGLQPAEAIETKITGGIAIPSINLISAVTELELEDHRLNTPDTIVGSFSQNQNKTLLIGHSSTVFKNLYQTKVGDSIFYNNVEYKIIKTTTLLKSEIDMDDVLREEANETLIIMTCAGEPMGEKDATHRLLVTALKK